MVKIIPAASIVAAAGDAVVVVVAIVVVVVVLPPPWSSLLLTLGKRLSGSCSSLGVEGRGGVVKTDGKGAGPFAQGGHLLR